MIYTGIGSRKAPAEVLTMMSDAAFYLAERGWKLRSGHAKGSDQAFEQGAKDAKGDREIFLPWNGFQGGFRNTKGFYVPELTPKLLAMAEHYHPAWHRCTDEVKKLHARNVCQVLGVDLKTPSDMVVCWTPQASGSGGTGQAIRIAHAYHIPVFDLASEEQQAALVRFVKERE